jgi:hypothetical protein
MSVAKIKILILILVGIGILIYYKLTNLFSKVGGQRIVEKIKSDPKYAHKLLKSLDFFYMKKEFIETSFNSKILTINENFMMDDHKILILQKIDIDNYLFITICSEMDFNLTASGRMGDVKKNRLYNFKLSIDRQNTLIKAYSNSYVNRDEKFLKENFLSKLFTYLMG